MSSFSSLSTHFSFFTFLLVSHSSVFVFVLVLAPAYPFSILNVLRESFVSLFLFLLVLVRVLVLAHSSFPLFLVLSLTFASLRSFYLSVYTLVFILVTVIVFISFWIFLFPLLSFSWFLYSYHVFSVSYLLPPVFRCFIVILSSFPSSTSCLPLIFGVLQESSVSLSAPCLPSRFLFAFFSSSPSASSKSHLYSFCPLSLSSQYSSSSLPSSLVYRLSSLPSLERQRSPPQELIYSGQLAHSLYLSPPLRYKDQNPHAPQLLKVKFLHLSAPEDSHLIRLS